MRKRIVSIFIISFSIILATYIMRLIVLNAYWFEHGLWIVNTASFLTYCLPIFIFLSFFKRLLKIAAFVSIIALVLGLTYGFSFVGVNEMTSFENYLHLTIAILVGITSLVLVIYHDK